MDSGTKILFILIDGVGDLGINKLNGKTPLQSAQIPTFDLLAKSGICGIMDPVETGLACGSDTAHMNIFGYNPFEEYKGRGAFETIGSGLPMSGNEIGFKCNFAYMDPETKVVKKRRVDRNFEQWGLELIESIDNLEIPGYDGFYIRAKHATEHRCGIKVCGKEDHKLSCQITGTDPLKDNLKLRLVNPTSTKQESIFTAGLVNALSDAIINKLATHPLNLKRQEQGLLPANLVLLRGCGQKLNVPSFNEKYGAKGFMVAPTAIINGLGQSIQLFTPKVEGATGDYHSNYIKKIEKAVELFKQDYDFGFVHIKAVDDAGHDKSIEKKIEYIEKVDQMLKHFIEIYQKTDLNQQEFVICLTGDHTTPVEFGDHTFEPVPVAIGFASQLSNEMGVKINKENKSGKYKDKATQYDEISCSQGSLGRFPASELMPLLMKLRSNLEGL